MSARCDGGKSQCGGERNLAAQRHRGNSHSVRCLEHGGPGSLWRSREPDGSQEILTILDEKWYIWPALGSQPGLELVQAGRKRGLVNSHKTQGNPFGVVRPRLAYLNLLVCLIILITAVSCLPGASSAPTAGAGSTPTTMPTPSRANYYVDAQQGRDSYPGTQTQPWSSIQQCLDRVRPGDTCNILGGPYHESLTLKTSGSPTATITIKSSNDQTVIVDSGSMKSLVTGGRIDYYTIEGLSLISSYSPSSQSDASIDLGANIPFSESDKTAGNNNIVFRNCYIEGSIYFYGHHNLMENCELNGKNVYQNAVLNKFAASYNNIYRKNLIHDYLTRGIWSMQAADNVLVQGNTIHDVQYGIDCDGAFISVTACDVVNNNVYNTGKDGDWGSAIYLENCFHCLAQGNTVHDIRSGVGIFAINYGNGSSANWHTFHDIEYRDDDSNTSILNNVIYNYPTGAGIYISSVSGLVIDHNSFYNVGITPPIGFQAETDEAGRIYYPSNETITNNIFFAGDVAWHNARTSGLTSAGNFKGDPPFLAPPGDLRLESSSPACVSGVNGTYAGAFPCN